MKRLTGQDATFLYLETPSMHMHVASAATYDTTDAIEPYSFDRSIELMKERLHLAPIMRQRLAMVPFGLHHPVWFDDPDFDLEYHVRRAALPAPGNMRQFCDLIGQVCSRPLNRDRPLWELYLVEGLEDERVGVITKTHHAAVDGVSGMELAIALLDLEPNPPPVAPPTQPWMPESKPTDSELLGYAVSSLAQQPGKLVGATRRLVESQLNVRRKRSEKAIDVSEGLPTLAPSTSFNVAITPHRSISFGELDLEEMKEVKNKAGATINDVVLTTSSLLLDAYLDRRNETVAGDLVASCPVSIRTEEQSGAMGNQVSAIRVSLHNSIQDPAERLAAIAQSTRRAKEEHELIGAGTLQEWQEFMPPALANRAARVYSRLNLANAHAMPHNLVISNVPGPPFPLYSFGAKQEKTLPIGPVNEGNALNVTVTSYLGTLYWGFAICSEATDDVWSFVDHLQAGFDDLKKAVGV